MTAIARLVAILAAVLAGVLGVRRLLARSKTQVHRINQDKPFVTEVVTEKETNT
jgi:hypothetical protein